MNPAIREFPSDQFYGGTLTDGVSTLERENQEYFQTHFSELKQSARVVFYDIQSSREGVAKGRPSKLNYDEANFTLDLVRHLILVSGQKDLLRKKISVITPYRGHCSLL
jgi:superfamily I DNA and/or RNA helicase